MNWICSVSSTLLCSIMFLSVTSCGGAKDRVDTKEEVLIEVADSALTMRDILAKIPSGLEEEDSVEMFRNLVDRWVKNMLLTDLARENENELERINSLAEDYRNSLIIERYLRGKLEEVKSVSASDIDAYYEQNKDAMIVETPLIKGVYLKLSDSDSKLSDIRKWIVSGTPEDIDKIEKNGLRNASQYEYFLDRWIEWSKVSEQIPYRFFDADAFLTTTKDFETTYGGSVYLLHISEYLPSGSLMPKEYAASKIEDILMRERRSDYVQSLLKSLYRKGMKDGKLKIGKYDPIEKKFVEQGRTQSE